MFQRSHFTSLTSFRRQLRAYIAENGNSSEDTVLRIQTKRNVLLSRLNRWLQIQPLFTPAVLHVRGSVVGDVQAAWDRVGDENGPDNETPECVALFLPSEIASRGIEGGCPEALIKMEIMLRDAQASDALQHIKNRLCTYQSLVHYKIVQVSGPGVAANARARNLLKRFKTIIRRSANRYRAARAALVA